jgi:hypothetical protein
MIAATEDIPPLEMIDGRWHCAGQGIHAGDYMELLCPDGFWLPVRVESMLKGQRLIAHFGCHGLEIGWTLGEIDRLRWPEHR